MRLLAKSLIFFLIVPVAWFHSVPKACAEPAPLKIVAFGTSLTARGGWPDALEAPLESCLGRPVAVEKLARSGSTSDWGVSQIDRVVSLAPDILLIEFYANDAALHRLVTPRRSRENLAKMLDAILQHVPNVRIFVMAMNPVSGIRSVIRPFLNSYIEGHRDVAREKGVNFIDHRPAWQQLSKHALAAAIPDGLHPQPETAAKIIVPLLVSRIAQDKCLQESSEADRGVNIKRPL